MKKSEKNNFEKMCDELDGKYAQDKNPIMFVREHIDKEVGNDYDLLLKIQAEAKDDDYVQYVATRVATIAMIFTAIGVILQLIPVTQTIWDNLKSLTYLVLIIWIMAKATIPKKYDSVRKWRKYVLTVLEERIEILKKIRGKGSFDYKDAYDKAINYLALVGDLPCQNIESGRNEECMYCMENGLNVQEKKKICWRKYFKTK